MQRKWREKKINAKVKELTRVLLDSLRECQSIEALAERLMRRGVRTEGWRAAEDELPTEERQYNVMIKGARLPTALYYHPGEQVWRDAYGVDYNVEWWQHMPLPPAWFDEEAAVCGRCVHFSNVLGEGECFDNCPDVLASSTPACTSFEPREADDA